MASNQVLGKLRFDTSAIDKQMQEVANKLNDLKALAAKAGVAGGSGSKGGSRGGGGSATRRAVDEDKAAIREVTAAYQRLTKAQTEYFNAQKTGNTRNMAYWQRQISDQQKFLTFVRDNYKQLVGNEQAQRKIVQTINDAEVAQRKHNQTVADYVEATKKAAQVEADRQAKAAQAEADRQAKAAKAEADAVATYNQKTKAAADAQVVKGIADAYRQLTAAQKEYIAARKKNDEEGKSRSTNEITEARAVLDVYAKRLEAYNLDAKAKHEAQSWLMKSISAEDEYRNAVRATLQVEKERADEADRKKAEAAQKETDQKYINQMKAAVTELKTIYQGYIQALKSGNEESIKYWGDQIEGAKQAVGTITHNAAMDTNVSPGAQTKVLKSAVDAERAEVKFNDAVAKTNENLAKQGKAVDANQKQMQQMVQQAERWLATMVVMRGLRDVWQHATAYASQYYDAMNEIRIVTMMSQEEADALGAKYRQMAQDMSVSSTEIAKAAVEYWRQGLEESEVESRLQYTTMYAKISAMDFTEAAELMTAATNSMGLSADRVADVWAYLGDASASGADEVGTAMQKVSAVAETAGVQFEWLGAYIATLSEKTRQAPEAIGTALNSIISRLQQIKQKGFNSDDIYGINDIAKALGSLEQPIALMDEATGKWRDLPAVLNDIAAQWQNLTDKEKAYIATTMGGTRQRNYLLTLLDDLSQASKNGSRAWKLYEGALNSAGTAMEKYSIWEESIEAAQGRFNAQLEELYSMLDGATIKGFYDVLAGIVEVVNNAASAMDGWNIKLGLAAGGIALLGLVIRNVVVGFASMTATAATATAATAATGAAATAAAGGISLMNIALMATAAGLVIAGIATLVGYFISQGKAADKAAENTKELAESLSGGRNASGDIADSIKQVKDQSDAFTGTEKDVQDFNAARQDLIAQYPGLRSVLQNEIKTVGELGQAYSDTIDYLEKYNEARIRANYRAAHEGIGDAESAYNQGRNTYTGQMHQIGAGGMVLTSLQNSVDMGHVHTADPVELLSGVENWNINAYQTAINAFEGNIAILREKLKNSEGDLADIYLDALNAWDNALYSILYPGMDKMASEADEIMQNSLEVILTDALNPYRFTDIGMDIPDLLDEMLSMEFKNEYGLPMTVDEIRARVPEIVDAYKTAISDAKARVATAVASANDDNLGEDADFIIDNLFSSLKNAHVSDDKIIEIMEPLFTAIGMARDEMLNRLFGDSEQTGGGGSDDLTFDEKLKNAIGFIERLEDIQGVIADIVKDGSITKDVLDALTKLFSPEMLEEMFEQAKDAAGELDLSEFVQILRDKMTEAQEEYEGNEDNLLLSALGFNEVTEEKVQEALDKIAKASSVDEIIKIWEGLPEKVKEAIGETGKEIEQMINDAANDSESSAERIEKSMQRIKRSMQQQDLETHNKVWSDLDDIMDDLTSTLDDAMGAISDIQTHMHDAGEAAGALQAAAAGDKDALKYLADMTGLTAEMLANDLSPAEYLVAQMGDQASASQSFLADWLYQVGAINLDPTGKIVPIASIEEAANSCGMTVAALANALALFNGSSLTWSKTADGLGLRATARVPAIKWTGGTAKKSSGSGGGSGKKGGGGGGGGGSGSNQVSELVETLVDEFSKLNELRDHRRELAQLGQSYHEARGEIQGVIAYLEMERSIVEEDTAALEGYLASLEAQIEANREIVTTQAAGSKAYNQAMIDLDKLQEEHQKYSQQLIKNKTDVEKLTEAVKEQYDKIRQMEIDLRNTILEAIEDREKAEERKLNGRIEMEEEILDVIKKRYEAERDQIIETQNLRKEALEDEINQIDELLEARKKLAEQEDKMAEIAALEEQIQRISADPTRQKEAMQLREKLAKLREDMAWDAAEAEAQAQKDSIKQQITSIDEYIDYVQKYYEDLFKHPQKLIEEMEEILRWTDDQIIAWLKANTEGYAEQTEATQRKMVNSWQSTLDDMRDTIRTHWEEVEQIIAGGADNIINFLTTYSQKYREAGKLQAEAYVDEWRKQLKDLENAYKQVNANIESYNYVATTKVNSSGGSGGGGGGLGGGSGAVAGAASVSAAALNGITAGIAATLPQTGYRFKWQNSSGLWIVAPGDASMLKAFDNAKRAAQSHWGAINSVQAQRVLADLARASTNSYGNYIKKFALGGMNTTTGLAWLDGTKQKPERILNPYQTELFEDMISTLHAIRRVSTGGMWTSAPRTSTASALPNIDSITINVQSLDSNADYEDGAEKLMNAFYEKIARTRPVGGIQGW